MRRKLPTVSNARNRAIVYASSLLALGIYALPKIPALQPGLSGTFSMVWILFAILALASNLYFMFGADQERSRLLEARAARDAEARADTHKGFIRLRQRG
jgi:hypothetical protein